MNSPEDHKAWDELIGTLYSEEDRAKIEWAIGAMISDHSHLEIFNFYGPARSGKTTTLRIIEHIAEMTSTRHKIAFEVSKIDPRSAKAGIIFVEVNEPSDIGFGSVIRTTGKTVDFQRYRMLLPAIDAEVEALARKSVKMYKDGGSYLIDTRNLERDP